MKICFSGTMDIRQNHDSTYNVLVSYTCKNLFQTPILWKAHNLTINQIESLILRQPKPQIPLLTTKPCTKPNKTPTIKRKINQIS